MMNNILNEDLELLAARINCEEIKGKTFFVTGATGLIGSACAKALLKCNELFGAGVKVVAFMRNPEKAKAVFEGFDSENLILFAGDINNAIDYKGEVDFIIHGASATSSKFFVSNPVETINTAMAGTNNILTFAKNKGVSSFVYLSSLEVYGTPDPSLATIKEDYSGYIDQTSVRSSYSEGKRLAETLCCSYASEYGVPVKIARLSQTFGAGVDYNDGRVFAEFARCAIEGRDIVLHTQGKTVRSYCYTTDAVDAIFKILLKGENMNAYNVTNMNTACSIYEMGETVCKTFPEAGIKVVIDIPEDASSFGYNPEMIIRLDSAKLESLGWHPEYNLEEMFLRLVESMKK